METEIKNKIVVVTGGSRGIGFAISKEFLKHGAQKIVILDINEENGVIATSSLNSDFGAEKATFLKCDVTTDLDAVFREIFEKFKSIDVLVNNAGIVEEKSIKKTMALNAVATIEWTMKFWNHVRKDKGGIGGTVVNVASVYGFVVDPFIPFYKASKFAVVGFTRTIGHKINYEQTGVRVIAVCPGFTETKLAYDIELSEDQQFSIDKYKNIAKKSKWLSTDAVAKATTEIFQKAESGSIWSVVGGEPVVEIPVPPEFRTEHFIDGEL